ncbi:hypothetical protein CYY_003117 [Polysphondylium violaceum]|uniref:Cytochrome P450 family protein n=1 Tax=Polysphondylium violaceum TaxID=133409 RepID=A0A8J4PZ14_9MYCE|nr:hypothetical protein CYY_003117 [Polysphondylium violaceum]
MSIFWLLISVLITLIYFNYVKKLKNYGPKSLKGPMPLPVIGNFHNLGCTAPHIPLFKFHEVYGPIYRIWMGDTYTVVLNDLDLIRKMLVHNASNFMERLFTPTLEFYSGDFSSLAFSKMHDWKDKRNIVSRSLVKNKAKNIEMVSNQVDNLLDCMEHYCKSNKPFPPRKNMQRFAMNTILKFVMNQEIPYDHQGVKDGPMKSLLTECDKVFIDLGTGKLGDYIDFMKPLLTLHYKWFDTKANKLRGIVLEEFKNHLSTFELENKENPRDLMDVMIGEFEGGESMDSTAVSMTLDIVLAGTDTIAGSLEWCLLFMANYPEYQEMAHKELEIVVGKGRKSMLADRISTPFVNAFIKESSRYKVVAAFSLPRVCSEDIEIDDYFIPKGSQILLNHTGIARNPEYWENPEIFDPTRHLKKNQEFSLYGYGPRNCIGQSLAQDKLYLAITNILLRFKVGSVDGNPIDETEIFGLTLHPNLFNLKLSEREKNIINSKKLD